MSNQPILSPVTLIVISTLLISPVISFSLNFWGQQPSESTYVGYDTTFDVQTNYTNLDLSRNIFAENIERLKSSGRTIEPCSDEHFQRIVHDLQNCRQSGIIDQSICQDRIDNASYTAEWWKNESTRANRTIQNLTQQIIIKDEEILTLRKTIIRLQEELADCKTKPAPIPQPPQPTPIPQPPQPTPQNCSEWVSKYDTAKLQKDELHLQLTDVSGKLNNCSTNLTAANDVIRDLQSKKCPDHQGKAEEICKSIDQSAVNKSKQSITELRALIQQKSFPVNTKRQLLTIVSQSEQKLATCTKAQVAVLILKNLQEDLLSQQEILITRFKETDQLALRCSSNLVTTANKLDECEKKLSPYTVK